MAKQHVLFLCTGNSARSQMAEAFLRKYGSNEFYAHSAGLQPTAINPLTVQVLEEIGINTSRLKAKPLETYIGKINFSYLITVCSIAEKHCPIFPGMGDRLHWPFEDPAACDGSDEIKLAKFRKIRDQIETKVIGWFLKKIDK